MKEEKKEKAVSFYDDYMAYCKSCKTKYKDDSIRKFVAYLKVFLNYAIKNGLYSSIDYHKLVFPKLTTNVREEVFSLDEWLLISKNVESVLIKSFTCI